METTLIFKQSGSSLHELIIMEWIVNIPLQSEFRCFQAELRHEHLADVITLSKDS